MQKPQNTAFFMWAACTQKIVFTAFFLPAVEKIEGWLGNN